MLAYYPNRSSPLWWRLTRGESRGRRHYVGDEPFLRGPGRCRRWCISSWPTTLTQNFAAGVGSAALLKAVWWGMRLASLLTHLFIYLLLKSKLFVCYQASCGYITEVYSRRICSLVTSAKVDLFSSLFVCLSVWLLATLRKNFPNGFAQNFQGRLAMGQGTND